MSTGIMVAPNGARLKYDEHQALPLKLDQIVKTAKNCEDAGATAMHLHVRDENLNHLLDINTYKETMNAIQDKCSKDFIVQVTTEAVGQYSPNEMINLIKGLKPQATSIAIKELLPQEDSIKELKAAKDLYTFARAENIGIQHILYSSEDVQRFYKLCEQGIIPGDKHSVLFVLGRYAKNQQSSTSDLLPYLFTSKELNLQSHINWMVCAFGQNEIPSLLTTSTLGGHCRIGFENSRVLQNGGKAKNNESQVKFLKQQLESLNLDIAKGTQMREILGVFK